MASFYTIATNEKEGTFFEHFLKEHISEFECELLDIIARLKSMGTKHGAAYSFFKVDEGLEIDDRVCAIYDKPNVNLRLYCIRLSKQIVILGNGGYKAKNTRAWQDNIRLSREVHEMMRYSAIIREKIKTNKLFISTNKLTLEV